jgi:hypothetical protein
VICCRLLLHQKQLKVKTEEENESSSLPSPSPSYHLKSIGTDVIHEGQTPDAITGAVILPINLTTTYSQTVKGNVFLINEFCKHL